MILPQMSARLGLRQGPRSKTFVSLSGAAPRRIPPLSGLVMDLLHQRLQRTPANFAKVSVFIWHKLLAVAGAIDADVCPSQILVRFAKAAIANECRFRTHGYLPAFALHYGNRRRNRYKRALPPFGSRPGVGRDSIATERSACVGRMVIGAITIHLECSCEAGPDNRCAAFSFLPEPS